MPAESGLAPTALLLEDLGSPHARDDALIYAELVVTSDITSPAEVSSATGLAPTRTQNAGGQIHPRSDRVRDWNRWVFRLDAPETHLGTVGISTALLRLGDHVADSLSGLVAHDCAVTLSIVQEVDRDAGAAWELGLNLTPDAIAWLARAKASLDVDQYLTD